MELSNYTKDLVSDQQSQYERYLLLNTISKNFDLKFEMNLAGPDSANLARKQRPSNHPNRSLMEGPKVLSPNGLIKAAPEFLDLPLYGNRIIGRVSMGIDACMARCNKSLS